MFIRMIMMMMMMLMIEGTQMVYCNAVSSPADKPENVETADQACLYLNLCRRSHLLVVWGKF